MTEIRTYHTRLRVEPNDAAVLTAYAELFGRVERTLFARLSAGGVLNRIKCLFLMLFTITARQFNAASASVRGKISAVRETRSRQRGVLERRIARAKAVLARGGSKRFMHEKKRRLAHLLHRHATLVAAEKADQVSLCFGSRKLFRAQFARQENGFATHAAWRELWQQSRSGQFLVLGSKDETAGCQGCVATVADDTSIALRLRLPGALKSDKYLTLSGLRFAHGHEHILAAIGRNLSSEKNDWQPITYRFCRDAKGWRVFVSVAVAAKQRQCIAGQGMLGLDLNADHLAVTETDRFGNPVASRRIDCLTRGKTAAQRQAVIGDAVREIVAWAVRVKKPIAVEKLDFTKKKDALEKSGVRYSRMLSGLAYAQIQSIVRARAYDAGIVVTEVNPAYTSVIGEYKFARRYGLSSHQGAALAIGRRSMGLRESLPNQLRGTLPLSVRNRGRHVWSAWAAVSRNARAAPVAPGRSRRGLDPTGTSHKG